MKKTKINFLDLQLGDVLTREHQKSIVGGYGDGGGGGGNVGYSWWCQFARPGGASGGGACRGTREYCCSIYTCLSGNTYPPGGPNGYGFCNTSS
ncbi:MAG: hypothetical protein V4714_00595 [Bacteroidota bacterium]